MSIKKQSDAECKVQLNAMRQGSIYQASERFISAARLKVNVNSHDEHWIHIPLAFCGRLRIKTGKLRPNYTPPHFAGLIVGPPFRINSIVIIVNVKLAKISLVNCDAHNPYLIENELKHFFEEKPMKNIQIFVFSQDKGNAFNDAILSKPLHSDIRVKFIDLNPNITVFAIKNTKQTLINIKKKKFNSFIIKTKTKNMKVISHPKENKLLCSRLIAILICQNELHETLLPWLLFDGQYWQFHDKWYILDPVKDYLNALPANASIVECLSTAHLITTSGKQINKGMAALLPSMDIQQCFKKLNRRRNDFSAEERLNMIQDHSLIPANDDELKQIALDIDSHARYDLVLSSAASAAQLIKNDTDVLKVISMNAEFVIDIFSGDGVAVFRKYNLSKLDNRINEMTRDVYAQFEEKWNCKMVQTNC